MNMLPSPRLTDLIRALLFRSNPEDHELALPWAQPADLAYWFSRSAWSMAIIAKWRNAISPKVPVVMWVPDYFCNQSLVKVRQTGVSLVFYPVDSNRNPDWKKCNELAAQSSPDIFLAVHYFGIKSDSDSIRSFCNRYKTIIIEDCAHVLLPQNGIGTIGDFVFYSPHKLLAIPDGSLLLVRPSLMRKIEYNKDQFIDTFETGIKALPKGTTFPRRWLLRSLIQKLAPWLLEIKYKIHEKRQQRGNGRSMMPEGPHQSLLSRRLLKIELPRIEVRGWDRALNAAILASSDELTRGREKIQASIESGFPFLFGLLSKNDSSMSNITKLTRSSRIPSLKWPDLPPEVFSASENHKEAIDMLERGLFFPVHHSIKCDKVLSRLRFSRKKISEKNINIKIRMDLSVSDWNLIYVKSPKCHLQQSRAYLNAHADDSLRNARFGAIEINSNIVGIFSVIELKGPFGTVLGRLNRGPIWSGPPLSDYEKVEIIKKIAKDYKRTRGRLLYIAPNILMTSSALSLLKQAGVHRLQKRPWHSSWVDLQVSEQQLLDSLGGKWRNQLNAAKKSGLIIKCDTSESSSEWILSRHSELMALRGIEGPTTKFIRALRLNLIEDGGSYFAICAQYEGKLVAGISVAQHGGSGTYLLGWNGGAGRKMHANNYLLWTAFNVLKDNGCSYIDLGGINEWGTRGIAAFKRGAGGEEFRLVGEYYC